MVTIHPMNLSFVTFIGKFIIVEFSTVTFLLKTCIIDGILVVPIDFDYW